MIDVVFSDGHTEQIGNVIEWMELLEATHEKDINLYATITSDMYDGAISDLGGIDLPIAERVVTLLTVAKENNIESVVFI